MNQEDKQKCEYCLYLIIASIFFLILCFITPNTDRELIRDFMGAITAVSSFIGIAICIYVTKFLSQGNSNLNRRLKHVYVMTAFVLLCTMGMGVAGYLSPSIGVWDKIYNIRTLAIILEVLAVSRFVYTWVKIGRS